MHMFLASSEKGLITKECITSNAYTFELNGFTLHPGIILDKNFNSQLYR